MCAVWAPVDPYLISRMLCKRLGVRRNASELGISPNFLKPVSCCSTETREMVGRTPQKSSCVAMGDTSELVTYLGIHQERCGGRYRNRISPTFQPNLHMYMGWGR